MRCCVIGGAGFIGQAFVPMLVDSGREVHVLGRRPPDAVAVARGASYTQGDYSNRDDLRRFLQGAQEVVDLAYATVPQTSFVDPVFDILANLPPSVALLQEAGAAGARRVVIVSSGGTVYGRAGTLPISEDHPTHPISPYGITKLTIENYARMFHAVSRLPVVIVRPGNAYGEHQRAGTGQGFVAAALNAVLRGEEVSIYGAAGTVRDYVHVQDVARGLLAALDRGVEGETYNVGTGTGLSNLDVLHAIEGLARPSGFNVNVRTLPPRSFDVPANVLDSSKLQSATGWQPEVDFATGLAGVWDAFRASLA